MPCLSCCRTHDCKACVPTGWRRVVFRPPTAGLSSRPPTSQRALNRRQTTKQHAEPACTMSHRRPARVGLPARLFPPRPDLGHARPHRGCIRSRLLPTIAPKCQPAPAWGCRSAEAGARTRAFSRLRPPGAPCAPPHAAVRAPHRTCVQSHALLVLRARLHPSMNVKAFHERHASACGTSRCPLRLPQLPPPGWPSMGAQALPCCCDGSHNRFAAVRRHPSSAQGGRQRKILVRPFLLSLGGLADG